MPEEEIIEERSSLDANLGFYYTLIYIETAIIII